MKKSLAIVLLVYLTLIAGSASAAPLQDAERDKLMQPERVMDAVGVGAGMVIGEVGAGKGYFTYWLSKRVGQSGLVYANDIDEKALKGIEERCQSEGIENVLTVLGAETRPNFPTHELDMVFMVHVLHQINYMNNSEAFLMKLRHHIKAEATVVVIEPDPVVFEKEGLLPANRLKILLTKEKTEQLLAAAGFELVRHEDFLEQDNVSVFRMKR